MKAKVLNTFTDGKAKTIREEGEIIELTKERFKELNELNLLEEVKTEEKKEKPKAE